MQIKQNIGWIAAVLIILAAPTSAVTITNERDPTFAVSQNISNDPFSGIGVVRSSALCTGTVIGNRSVLTAAHCLSKPNSKISFSIPLEDKPYFLSSAVATIFPGYNPALASFQQLHVPDLAILTLEEMIPSYVTRYKIASLDSNDIGELITAVGYGRTGTGSTGQIEGSNSKTVKRFGLNNVDWYDADGNFLVADFDSGLSSHNRLGGIGTGLLEASVAPGDSGGPAFFNPLMDLSLAFDQSPDRFGTMMGAVPNEYFVLGVASYTSRFGDQLISSYGTTSHWANASKYASWIREVSADVSVVSPIPVPASVILLGLALAMLTMLRSGVLHKFLASLMSRARVAS